jgi:hypothetical protein
MTDERDQDYYEKEFRIIAESNGVLVGQQEIQSRLFLGDAEYEKLRNFNDDNANANLSLTIARVQHVNAVAGLLNSAAFAVMTLPVLTLLGVILYWFH